MVLRLLAAGFSGLLLALGLPKFNLTFCLWFGLVPLFWALEGRRGRPAFLVGLVQGLVQNLVVFYWIVYVTVVYGKLPLPVGVILLLLLATYLSLYRGVWAWLFRWGEDQGLAAWWWGPALWVALEYLQTFLLTGFPWMLLGYGLEPTRYLLQVVDLTGVYGLSALIVLVNLGFWAALQSLRSYRFNWQPVLAALVLFGMVLGYGYWRLPQIEQLMVRSPALTVAVIQGNIEQGRKWDPQYQGATLAAYQELSLGVKGQQPDLIVWPETAAPFFFLRERELTARVTDIVRQSGTYLLLGSPALDFGPQGEFFYNRAYLLAPQGEVVGYYDKAHLVPYGEYVPLRRFFPFIGKMVPMVGDFAAGPPGVVLSLPATGLGTLICFESIFPYLSRAMVTNGAGLLVNMTNDAWFGTTSAPYQHLAMAVVRAVETRRSLARAANTGISALVLPDGQLVWSSGLFVPAAGVAKLPVLSCSTVYQKYGEVFAGTCASLSLLGSLMALVVFWRRSG